MLQRIHIDSLFGTSMVNEICLTITIQIATTNPDRSTNRLLEKSGCPGSIQAVLRLR
jgi:hypothetical protein